MQALTTVGRLAFLRAAARAPALGLGAASPAISALRAFSAEGSGGGMGDIFKGMGPEIKRMQQQLKEKPELMEGIANSPVMKQMMENPEMFKQMIEMNPQMKTVRKPLRPPARSAVEDCMVPTRS
jgi:hypothetical protein